MVSRPPEDDVPQEIVERTVAGLERDALERLRAAAYGEDPARIPRPDLLGHVDPRVLAQLFLAALGRGDHPLAETNPVYALYEVARAHDARAQEALARAGEPGEDGPTA